MLGARDRCWKNSGGRSDGSKAEGRLRLRDGAAHTDVFPAAQREGRVANKKEALPECLHLAKVCSAKGEYKLSSRALFLLRGMYAHFLWDVGCVYLLSCIHYGIIGGRQSGGAGGSGGWGSILIRKIANILEHEYLTRV